MALSDDLTAALRSAPELSSTPGIALASAQTQDPIGNAQAAAYSTNTVAVQGAVNDLANQHHDGGGFLGLHMSWLSTGWKDVRHVLGDTVSAPLKLVNAGLADVTHQWRYLHDVVAKHGLTAGLLEAVPLIAGTTAGILLAPETGGSSLAASELLSGFAASTAATVGGEATQGLVARLDPRYQDSWHATTDGNAYRDPHSGLPVSPGRDLAGLFGLKEHKGLDMFNVVSGITDGLFDMKMDPASKLLEAGKLASVARRTMVIPEDVNRAYQASGGFRNAVDDLKTLTSGQILTRYPKFTAIANRLGPETTTDGILNVFRDALAAGEISGASAKVAGVVAPSRNVLSAIGVGAKIKLQDVTGPVKWAEAQLGQVGLERAATRGARESFVAKLTRALGNNIPTYIDNETGNQIKGAFDIMSDDAGRVTYQTMRMVGAPRSVAEDVATSLMNESTEAGRREIYKNQSIQTILARAKAATGQELDTDFIKQLEHEWDQRMPQGVETGRNAKYDYDLHGRDLSKVTTPDGSEFTAGTMASDLGLTAIPNYDWVRELVRGKNHFNQILGKTDDWFVNKFTNPIFKPLALVQPGTGMRIAAGEAAPTIARFGLKSYAGALIRDSILKARGNLTLETDLSNAEIDNYASLIARLRGGTAKLAGVTDEQLADDARYLDFHGGAMTPASMRAGHGISDIIGKKEQVLDTLHAAAQEVPKGQQLSNDFAGFGNTDQMHLYHWQAWLRRLSGDEATQKAAGAYVKATEAGASIDEATRAAAGAHTAHWAAQPEEVLSRYHRSVMTADPSADPLTEWGQTVAEALKGATHTPFREGVPAAVGGVAPTIEGGAYGTAREAVQARQAGEWSDHLLSGEKGSDFLDDAYGRGTKYEVPVPKGDTVTVYRAVPTGETAIRPGQYVSASRVYAEEHLEQHLSGLSTENPALAQGGHVISTEIPKSELGLAGANELIWVPSELPASEAARETALAARSAPGGAVPNLDLLKAVRDGKVVPQQLLEQIPVADRPLMVPGRTLVPDSAGTIQKIANRGWKTFIDPIISTFARDPQYRLEWQRQFDAFKPAIEAGEMHDSEAMQYASQRAMKVMRGLIHNPKERSLFSANVTNWLPFWYAQEQAYKRAGRLLLEDPGAFRKYQLAMSAMHDVAHPPPDENGMPQGSIFIPGTGFLGKYVPAVANVLKLHTLGSVPVGFAGNLQSLQTVSPLVEDPQANFGPLAVFVGKTVAHMFPETTGLVDKVIGPEAAAGGAWETLIPNTTLRRIVDAQRMDSRSNQSAMMHIVQVEGYKQEQSDAKWILNNPEPPPGADHDAWLQRQQDERENIVPRPGAPAMEKQEFLNRVKNHTRILDYLKAAIGFASPMAPQYRFGDWGLGEDLQKRIKDNVKAGKTASEAIQDFLIAHPDADPYTVAQSESADRSPIQASHPAQQWIRDNIDLVHQFPLGAAYLVPQGGTKDAAVYNEQLAMGLRRKRTPQEFLDQIYIAQGNHDFFDKDRKAYIQALVDNKGNKAATKNINTQWQQFIQDKGAANPVWLDDYQSVDRQNAQKTALSQLQTIVKNNLAPPGTQSDAVKGLMEDYDAYQAAGMPGRRDQLALRARKNLDVQWEQYLDGLVKERPELAMVVNRLFRSLSDKDRQLAGLGERSA